MDIKKIIQEEIMTSVANFPRFGDRLNSISETGEGSSHSYPYRFDNVSDDEVNYHFDTEEDEYVVIINLVDMYARVWEMQFGTVDGTPETIVNRGRMYSVMATVMAITNDFIDKYKPNALKFRPSKDEDRDDDKRRFNLYSQYIKKNGRNDYISYPYGDYIVIERKAKIKTNIPRI